jgi:hypothetical protein
MIIKGTFTAPEDTYIQLAASDPGGGDPVITFLTADDSEPGRLPDGLRNRLGLPDESYRFYTDGTNAVYVRIPATGGGSKPSYISRTLTDSATGVTVSGDDIHRMRAHGFPSQAAPRRYLRGL